MAKAEGELVNDGQGRKEGGGAQSAHSPLTPAAYSWEAERLYAPTLTSTTSREVLIIIMLAGSDHEEQKLAP